MGKEATEKMIRSAINALDLHVLMFDKDRKVIFENAARSNEGFVQVGSAIGAAQAAHLVENEYFDENGNLLDYPYGSAIELALKGIETRNLIIEHRNRRRHTHRWLWISCKPFFKENGEFDYGVMSYGDVSERKSRENKLKFLVASSKILSLTMDFETRLQEKARLTVPSLADWCAIDIIGSDNVVKRAALVHRDPEKVAWLTEYERRFPLLPGVESAPERVIRTGTYEFTPEVTPEMIDSAPNMSAEQRFETKKIELSSIMVIPISQGGRTLGCITLAYAESGRRYSDSDLSFFQEFANHLSVVLENGRLYEEISKRDQAKDIFLASLSHELRNPLAPIKSAVELLRLKNRDTSLNEELDVIEHQFEHMARLLNDLLDSTRFTRGKINIQLVPIDISPAIEHVVKAIRPLAEQASISLHVAYPPRPLYVSADKTRLEQTLTNLLHNAVKFTPRGGSIWVDVAHDNDRVSMHVRDNGAGLSTSELKRVFEPYYQSERVRTGNSGLGLGLRLVHEIIRLHGGSVKAKSDGIHSGSEFTIHLPLLSDVTTPAQATQSPEIKRMRDTHILVVDDNQPAADGLVKLLKVMGWSAEALYAAMDVIPFLQTHTVDMVLLDIGMPEMDGHELVRKLRTLGMTNLPVVALTGYGLEEDKRKAMQSGFTSHLTKPIGAAELRSIIAEVIPA